MAARRISTTHGPRLDDALSREAKPLEHGGEARAQEERELEGAGEDERRVELEGAAGLPREPALARRELSRHLRPSAFPATREALLAEAAENDAPGPVVELLDGLPGGREYATVYEVWEALGGELEPVERAALDERRDEA